MAETEMSSDGAERSVMTLWRLDCWQCVPDLGGGNIEQLGCRP